MIVYGPSQLEKGFKALFIEQLASEPEDLLVREATTLVSSDSDHEDYAWLGEVASLSEFVDEVQFEGLSDASYALINKKYVGGLAVKRDDLADEKTGGLALRIRDLAQRASRYRSKLLVDALIAGTSTVCYDADNFFSATHPKRGKQTATQSNIVTQTGTTTALVQADLASAIAALYNFVDEAVEPLNESFSRLFICYPPALHKPIAEAVLAGVVSQTSNVQFSSESFSLIRQPRLTSTSAANFYVGISDALVRGLIYQDREPVSFEAQEGPDSDSAFLREVYRYKVRMRGRAGYGRWQRMIKVA